MSKLHQSDENQMGALAYPDTLLHSPRAVKEQHTIRMCFPPDLKSKKLNKGNSGPVAFGQTPNSPTASPVQKKTVLSLLPMRREAMSYRPKRWRAHVEITRVRRPFVTDRAVGRTLLEGHAVPCCFVAGVQVALAETLVLAISLTFGHPEVTVARCFAPYNFLIGALSQSWSDGA